MTEAQKGRMARSLVFFCITVLTVTAVWALVLKSIGAATGNSVDLSDVLTYIGAAFGGELILLCAKRIFAKPNGEENAG